MSSSQEPKCTKSGLQIILEGKINRKKKEIDSLSQVIENMKIELIESKECLVEFTRHNLDPELAKPLDQQDERAISNLMYDIGEDEESIDIFECKIERNVVALEELRGRLHNLEEILSKHILSNIKPALPSSSNSDGDD
jgi:hypothetical protein